MADLIERDKIRKEVRRRITSLEPLYDSEYDYGYNAAMSKAKELVENAPAVNRWIPCSEKCPESIGMVLITWVNHNPPSYYAEIKDKPQTGAGHYFNGKWFWHSSVSEDHIAEYGYAFGIDCMDDKIEVIAWMPMPDAYEPPESDYCSAGARMAGGAENVEKNCENCARETCAVMPPIGKCYCDFWQAIPEPPESEVQE